MWKYYHYTRPQIEEVPLLEHVRELLVDGLVYFRRPSKLNDDMDCRPRMVRPSPAETESYLVRHGTERFPGRAKRRERNEAKQRVRLQLGNLGHLTSMWGQQAEEYGVLSMSKTEFNRHLWDEYGAKGRGMCIEFNFEHIIDAGIKNWIPFDVEYVDEQPSMNILEYLMRRDPSQATDFIQKSFRAKTRKWTPEEEVRVVQQIDDLQPPKIKAPTGTITGVILGWSMDPDHKHRILSWGIPEQVHEMVLSEGGDILLRTLK